MITFIVNNNKNVANYSQDIRGVYLLCFWYGTLSGFYIY